ncbi:hypothetical protein BX070DRAFT_223376 [Coemansia spiralis]|nr:hypothetical protein BX070DRAFT_223376 [Coemansia spiralis]
MGFINSIHLVTPSAGIALIRCGLLDFCINVAIGINSGAKALLKWPQATSSPRENKRTAM